MKRRMFMGSLAAIAAVPALPALPAASAPAIAVPTQARFWAIYMSALHGQCTPRTLQVALNIPAAEAKGYITQLIADGVIKPNRFAKAAFKEVMSRKPSKLVEKAKDKIDQKVDDFLNVDDEPEAEIDQQKTEDALENTPDTVT